MAITPEQAHAELTRRAALAELQRRKQVAEEPVSLQEKLGQAGVDITMFGPRLGGRLQKGTMQMGKAALRLPSAEVRNAGFLRQWGYAEEILQEQDPERKKQLLRDMSLSEQAFDQAADLLDKPAEEYKKGMDEILKNHPEWKSDPPDSFIGWLANPNETALAVAEAMPLLVGAGILSTTGHPNLTSALMFVTEGEAMREQALADTGDEETAALAHNIYGTVAGALETMQLQGLVKIAKGWYEPLLHRTVQKIGKQGMKGLVWGQIKIAAQEALEEMSQGSWEEFTAKTVYGKDIPGSLAGFIDRRASEAYIAAVIAGVAGVGGAAVGGISASDIVGASLEQGNITPEQAENVTNEIQQVAEELDVPSNYIVGNILWHREADKSISRFPKKIVDQESLEEVGNAIKDHLQLQDWDIEWEFTEKGNWGETTQVGPKKARIKIRKVTGEKLDVPQTYFKSVTQVGVRPRKPGEAFRHTQAEVKRTIVHELGHLAVPAISEGLVRREVHHPAFAKWVNEMVQELFAKKPGKAVPVSEVSTKVKQPPTVEKPINIYKTVSDSRTGITEQEVKYNKKTKQYTDTITGEGVVLDQEASRGALQRSIEAAAREAPLPKPKRISRKKALVLGHKLPEVLGWDEAQRRDFMQQTIGKSSMKDMTLDEMRTLVSALQDEVRAAGLEYVAPTPPVDELINTLKETKKITEPTVKEELSRGRVRRLARRIKSGTYSFVTGLERMERFFESLDGHIRGAFTKYIGEPVKYADELSTENANQDLDEFMGYLEDQDIDTAIWLGKTEDIAGYSLTPFQKIGTYMLSLNKNGKRQLTKGMGFTENDLVQIEESMTPQEKAAAEWLLEKYSQQWEIIRTVAIQIGIDPTKLKKEFRYSPIMRIDVELETQEDFLSGIIEGFTGEKYDPEHKFLEERKPSTRGKVELDAAVLYMHNIARTQRFIQFAPVVHSIGKILNSRKFKEALNDRTYDQGSKLINKWMKDSVRGTTTQATTFLSKTANIMRRNGIVYAIGFNIPSFMRQSLSLSNAVAVDPAMLMHAPINLAKAANPLAYKKMQEFVYARSLSVKNASYDRDLRTKANKAGLKFKLRGKRQWSQKAVSWIKWMDRHTRVVAWKSLYDTGIGKFNDEVKAIDYADKWIGRTQPMAHMKDLPHFFRGGTFEKLLTTFQNQVNNNANFYMYDILGAKKAGEISNTETGYRVMFSYVLPAVLFGMIGRGGLPKDWKQIAVDLATYPLAGVVVLGRWITRMIRGWGGSSTIAEAAPEEAGKFVGAIKRGDIWDIIKFATSTIGAATGTVPAQAIRTAEGAVELATGEAEDPRRLIYSEWALEQGKKKKKRKLYGRGL